MTVAASDSDTEPLLPTAEMDQILSTASRLLPQSATDYIELKTLSDDEPDPNSPHPQNNLGLYGSGKTSYRVAVGGLVFSTIFGVVCIGVALKLGLESNGIVIPMPNSAIVAALPSLCLNLLVTASTESTGFVHSKSLQAALISERQLQFNTNLRLIAGARHAGWTHPNGTFWNIIMGTLLVLSYISSSSVITPIQPDVYSVIFTPLPLLTLGIAIVLQTVFAFFSMRTARVLTWNSSPFQTTAALLHHNQLIHISGKCMHNVLSSDAFTDPCTPSVLQPSAWQAHPAIKRIGITLWFLGPVCLIWSGVVIQVGTKSGLLTNFELRPGIGSWSPLPTMNTSMLPVALDFSDLIWPQWSLALVVMAGIQGPLTMALHCCELLVNLQRDEASW